tara:strand:+ start:1027 stop:1293 length:267 start_codon:yes stop_codon:yes gene_type:complete
MRHAYLTNPGAGCNDIGGSRGGVGGVGGDGYETDYELEIGQNQHASAEMLSLCVYIDEVMEFLESCKSPIGYMVYRGIKAEQKRLQDQ